ncbi:MAG: DUF5709 domain-containing protein [Actinomycetota bacterium]|nr:DUF5709 domain-containing protein [Actinomycetota bacterium]
MTSSEGFGDSVYEGGDPVDDAEELDPFENLSSEDPDEIMQTGYSPPEREPHNLRYAPTPFEESQGESLDERLAEEEPDLTAADADADLTADPDPDAELSDDADSIPDADPAPRAGRLVAPDEGAHPDEESDAIAADVGPAGYASSAEEAAMHIVDEGT